MSDVREVEVHGGVDAEVRTKLDKRMEREHRNRAEVRGSSKQPDAMFLDSIRTKLCAVVLPVVGCGAGCMIMLRLEW